MQQSLWFSLPYIKCLLSRRREQPTTCFCICSTVQAELFTSSQWLSHMCLFWCWARIQTSDVLHGAGMFPAPALFSHEPSTPLRNSWKTRNGWRTKWGLPQRNLSPSFQNLWHALGLRRDVGNAWALHPASRATGTNPPVSLEGWRSGKVSGGAVKRKRSFCI